MLYIYVVYHLYAISNIVVVCALVVFKDLRRVTYLQTYTELLPLSIR